MSLQRGPGCDAGLLGHGQSWAFAIAVALAGLAPAVLLRGFAGDYLLQGLGFGGAVVVEEGVAAV